MANVGRHEQEQQSCPDTAVQQTELEQQAVGTSAALGDQQEIVSDMDQNSEQEPEGRHRSDRIFVPDREHHMRLVVALEGRLVVVSVRLGEGSDLEDPVVGVVVASTAETAPVTRQISIFAPDSTRWPCYCPSFVFARTGAAPSEPSEMGGVTWSSWSGFGLRAFAAGQEKKRSWFAIGLEEGHQKCCCKRHFVVGIGHSLRVASRGPCVLVVGSLP